MNRVKAAAVIAALADAACGQPGAETMVDKRLYDSPFGDNVLLFDPGMDMAAIQTTLDALSKQQEKDEFSKNRYALLFKPGEYDLNVTVDYYMHAAGLGQVPSDVTINGAVQSISSSFNKRVTIMFWRAAENILVNPVNAARPVYWAVSQAAAFRRMHIRGDLQFDLGSWGSGGFLANSIVDGQAGLTTGQQWFTRNSEVGHWRGGIWNRTFVGTVGTPDENWPETPNTVIDRTPVVRDKPFLVIDESGNFSVFVPALERSSKGVTWKEGNEAGKHIPIDDFHIAIAGEDTAASINAALDAGKHLLLTPGIYTLDASIRVTRPDTVVLGIGLATLKPATGQPAFETADVSGVVVAGLMVDAGLENSPVLIRIGDPGSDQDHSANPTSLHDIFCRVGGAISGKADVCLEINSDDVIVDHAWLWRADHGAGAKWTVNRSKHGLIVNGDDVTIYGLFNEHFQEYQTVWNGERGRVYFYQSEIPYDPPSQEEWMNGDTKGFASYKVADDVQSHQAYGLGIYSFFGVHQQRDPKARVTSAIEAPDREGVNITHVTTFAGRSGGIDHPINLLGEATNVEEVKFFDGLNPLSPTAALADSKASQSE